MQLVGFEFNFSIGAFHMSAVKRDCEIIEIPPNDSHLRENLEASIQYGGSARLRESRY